MSPLMDGHEYQVQREIGVGEREPLNKDVIPTL